MRIFPKNWDLSVLSVYGSLTSCKISEKTNEPIPRKALSLFYVYGPLTSRKKLEKTNEPILRTLRHGRTDGQTTLNS